ncbi:MAG: hypothetical protein FD119_2578 [Stygiobacter sp.]|nr:MAG: hypothetical protein FD119_2578 [Stygiobacter sp.]
MKSNVSVPVPTSQFIRLANFLREQGSDRDPVDAVSDAIEYWMENASWKPEDLLPETMNRGYTWKHKDSYLFLPHGTDIRMRYKDRTYYAKVEGDEIIYEGKPYSPASLANTIANSSRNAWRDLWIKKPGQNQWALADNCRGMTVKIDGTDIEL